MSHRPHQHHDTVTHPRAWAVVPRRHPATQTITLGTHRQGPDRKENQHEAHTDQPARPGVAGRSRPRHRRTPRPLRVGRLAAAKAATGGVTVAGAAFLTDQISKALVRDNLALCAEAPAAACEWHDLAGPLALLRTHNDGTAFDLLSGHSVGVAILIGLAAILLAARIAHARPIARWAAGLMAGGALSNLIDRTQHGAVTDFIAIELGARHNGVVVNPADIALLAGALLLFNALRQTLSALPILTQPSGQHRRQPPVGPSLGFRWRRSPC